MATVTLKLKTKFHPIVKVDRNTSRLRVVLAWLIVKLTPMRWWVKFEVD